MFYDHFFEYKGIEGYVSPFHDSDIDSFVYVLFYNNSDVTVYDIDDAMKTPFIEGKSLEEMIDQLENFGW